MGARLTLALVLAAQVLLVLWLLTHAVTASGPRLQLPIETDSTSRPPSPGLESSAPTAGERLLAEPATRSTPRAEPLARLRGRLSFRDGRPAAGLEVCLLPSVSSVSSVASDEERMRTTRTSPEGDFAFDVRAGRYQLGGAASAKCAAWCEEVELAAGCETRVERPFTGPQDLCVRVWQLVAGEPEPLAGAGVQVFSGELEYVDQAERSARVAGAPGTTDAEGRSFLRRGDDELLSVRVTRPGFHPSWIEADFRGSSSTSPLFVDGCLHVLLEREGPPITGTVLDPEGRPIHAALVVVHAPLEERSALAPLGRDAIHLSPALGRPFALTDPAGRFALAGPDPDAGPYGSLSVVVYPQRDELVQHQGLELDLARLHRPQEVVLRVVAGHEVEIELVDERGAPLQGLASLRDPCGPPHAPAGRLTPQNLCESSAGRTFPLQDGRFRLIHPGGEVRVGLSPFALWDEREFTLSLPRRPRGPLRLVIPAR